DGGCGNAGGRPDRRDALVDDGERQSESAGAKINRGQDQNNQYGIRAFHPAATLCVRIRLCLCQDLQQLGVFQLPIRFPGRTVKYKNSAKLDLFQGFDELDKAFGLRPEALNQFWILQPPLFVQQSVHLRQEDALGIKVGVAVSKYQLQLFNGPQGAPNARRHAHETNRSFLETLGKLQHVDEILEHARQSAVVFRRDQDDTRRVEHGIGERLESPRLFRIRRGQKNLLRHLRQVNDAQRHLHCRINLLHLVGDLAGVAARTVCPKQKRHHGGEDGAKRMWKQAWNRPSRSTRRLRLGAWAAAEAVLEQQPPNHKQCLADDVAGHLGCALETVGENDRHFRHPHSLPPDFVGHFNLETVAVGMDAVQVNGLQGATAKAFESAG